MTIFRRVLVLAAVVEVGADEHQPGQLALAAGGRLQADGVEPGHLAQDLLQLPLELERALRRVVLDERMQVARSPGSPTSRSLTRGLYFIVQVPSG